jgi:RNA polymerase sigma-70 factor (ECF subfamily)
MPSPEKDLTTLLSRVAARDREAFAQLYRATHLKLFGITLRILRRHELAEEILQEVYLRIWHRASDFLPSRGSPITWMATIARNRALDELRRRRPHHYNESGSVEEIRDARPTPSEQIETNDDLQRLEACLDKLDRPRRDAVRLAYLDGLSRKELAERFGQPLGTVKSWLHRSLKQLKDCLGL